MKKALFIDRDGTIIREPEDEQIDSLEKLEFVPGAIGALSSLAKLDFVLVMVSNQDGLGTPSFPEEDFHPAHNKMLKTLEGEGVVFDEILIDRSFPQDNAPTRKPRTGLLTAYMDGSYDLAASFVIGDRESDMELARNLGATGLKLGELSWAEIAARVRASERRCTVSRKTAETDISICVDLDGGLESFSDTGLKFFDHMLDQLPHHGGISLQVRCKGDLEVDEHHTVEDVGIALGEALRTALGDKRGIDRYGFALPMDESRAMVLLDLGGRSELVWDVHFTREYVGDVPTEMFRHFFKSMSDAMKANLYVKAEGENNHHIAEAVFKAFARTLRQAVRRDVFKGELPSSKGLL
ncbi:MAG: bifunctional histidinol-phosphatase/imidazoleglycerol-phosphate dehydratase HisB [Bacteroidales bacterium]|nr:bifunctional histidinol-phosphatase/imidazoleglycerol-phosphate dehydratase HisB [Bacteroidales bacterium]